MTEGSDNRPRISRTVRQLIYARDGYCCQVCGYSNVSELVLDHVVPWSRGGTSDESNLRSLCGYCNQRRYDSRDYATDRELISSGRWMPTIFQCGTSKPVHPALIVPSVMGITRRWAMSNPRYGGRHKYMSDEEFLAEFRQAAGDWTARHPELPLLGDLPAAPIGLCPNLMRGLVSFVMELQPWALDMEQREQLGGSFYKVSTSVCCFAQPESRWRKWLRKGLSSR